MSEDGGAMADSQVTVGKHIIERLESKLEQALKQEPLDIDFLEFVCQSEISLIASLSTHLDLPPEVLKGLQELSALVNDRRKAIVVDKTLERGRPKLNVHQEHVEELMAMDLSVPCIARLLGVSQRTLTRRMREWGLSMMDSYSTMSDEELDKLITEIKEVLPNLGYRQVRRRLNKLGYRVQWNRIIEAMHRIDGIGILQRMNKLGIVMSGTDKVPSPLSLVYIETNYKLVRYGIVLFAAIDGYSKKVLYLKVTNNNRPKTVLDYFLKVVDQHGYPSRVKGEWHAEHAYIAKHMFAARGRTGFISGRCLHSARMEVVWRNVWNAVSTVYYDVLHSLEADGTLNPTNQTHVFCAQHVFLPRIQKDLDIFLDGWNNHTLHSEGNQTPNQLWDKGMRQTQGQPVTAEGYDIPDVERAFEDGLHVPVHQCPLSLDHLTTLEEMFDINAPSACFGADIYPDVLHYVQTVLEDP